MDKEQFAIWLAGFIDGEGCIAIYRHPNCRNLNPTVQIVSTSETVLRFIYAKLGLGSILKRKIYTARAKQSWIWRTTGSGAYTVCKLVLPYLQLKCPQAKLVLKYWSKHIPYSTNKRDWVMRPENKRVIRQSFSSNLK